MLDVDQRKWKNGGQAKLRKANQNLDFFRRDCEKLTNVKEVVDKLKKVKVKKEEKVSEVD